MSEEEVMKTRDYDNCSETLIKTEYEMKQAVRMHYLACKELGKEDRYFAENIEDAVDDATDKKIRVSVL